MNYMNDYDITLAQQRLSDIMETQQRLADDQKAAAKIRFEAVQFLAAFKEEVDTHSDGWAYWKAPVAAANKLMEMLQGKTEATEANFKAAMSPIKAFYTRRGTAAGMKFPVIF